VTNPIVDPMVGRTVAHYEIVARRGGGGMGVVYEARDTRLGRTVALKFLPQQWSHDEGAKQRFVREAQAASATHHPNICTIHDIGTAADGQLFIVMAYYEGLTLKQRIEGGGPLPLADALDIATQVADGLAKAHAQGIVHRDVKPGNLILTEDGVRIVDFGLATFADALQLTLPGSTVGTAAYMSPEQVRGAAADARSDVWAVGVILYEMLTGRVPFRGTYAEAIAYAIRNDAPAPVREQRPEVPEEVEQLVFRALHKDPGVRYQNGRELARALRQARGHTVPLELHTQPIDVPARALSAPRRHRRLTRWAASLAAMLLAVALAGASLWWPPADRTRVAVVPFMNLTGDPDLEQYRLPLTYALTMALQDSRDLSVVPYSRIFEVVRRFLSAKADVSSRDAIHAIQTNTDATLVLVPALLREGGAWRARVEVRNAATATNIWDHDTEPVISSLSRDTVHRLAGALQQEIEEHFETRRSRVIAALAGLAGFGPYDPTGQAASLDAAKALADGVQWYDELEYAQARRAFARAVEGDARNPLPLAWLARAAQLIRDDKQATDAAERALSLLAERTSPVDRLFIEAVGAEIRRDAATAEERYRALVAERPDNPTWRIELAGFLDRQARPADAVAVHHEALALDARLLRPRLELCRLYSPSRLNEPADATMHGRAAVAGYRAIAAAAGEAQSLLCLADTLRVGSGEERVEAGQNAEAARAIFEKLGFAYNAARAEYYMALVAGMQGRFAESVSLGERALAVAVEAENRPLQPLILTNLGAAQVLLGNPSRAAEHYQQAYRLYQDWRDNVRAAQIQANRGAMLIEYGKPDEGILDVRNALAVFQQFDDTDYQVFCLRVTATYYRTQGLHQEAETELNKALALAQQANLDDQAALIRAHLALVRFERGQYWDARQLQTEVLARGGSRDTETRVRLARSNVRLGDTAAADAQLQAAERELQAAPNDAVRSLLLLVRGEWAYEAGRVDEARSYFEQASARWVDGLPDVSVLEARIRLGLLEAIDGRPADGAALVRSSLDAARRLEHVALIARAVAASARIEVLRRRPGEADRLLNTIAADVDRQSIDPEIRAAVHDARARMLDARGDADGAAADTREARRLVAAVADGLPDQYRQQFRNRRSVRELMP
jgi:tetratricopeptide (TPR) repeat protein/TolB-like protein